MGRDDPRSDETLVALANEGRDEAFGAIYLRHRDWAARTAARFVRRPDDCGDVVQEAFAELFERFPGFELTGTIRGFLYRAIRHRALDRIRRERPSVGLDDAPEIHLSVEPSGSDESGTLRRALAKLSPIHREVLLLRFVDDRSLGEIVDSLGIASGTVKSRLHNALSALRSALRESDPGGE